MSTLKAELQVQFLQARCKSGPHSNQRCVSYIYDQWSEVGSPLWRHRNGVWTQLNFGQLEHTRVTAALCAAVVRTWGLID